MYFHKIDHPYNFRFSERDCDRKVTVRDLGSDVFHISVESGDSPANNRWEKYPDISGLDSESFRDTVSAWSLVVSGDGALELSHDGNPVIASLDGRAYGTCGSKWLFCFAMGDSFRFYGMGEKNIGFEKSGIRTKFWNTDVWGDFSDDDGLFGITDPMYVSIPYMLVQVSENRWAGILVDNPYPVFMDTGARQVIEGVKDSGQDDSYFYLGSTDGQPSLYLMAGASAAEVTVKLQQLCGRTARPPLWSLGYHQSRWGYGSPEDLHELDRLFSIHGIPCDGLWLDIDYMDNYRVFTLNGDKFPVRDGEGIRYSLPNRKIVPILDPGIKLDPGYRIYDEGIKGDMFCLTIEGEPYVGFVWPGASVFPDYSLERVRDWWADHVRELVSLGVDGFWIDMNDPSTGSAELDEMHFSDGTVSHTAFHNQYGNAMAMATWKGLKDSLPEKRPFVLTRSGFTGINKYAAVWTGDNHSNYHHLRKAVEMQLSLGLSGVPFCSSDIGGFGCDAESENFIDWFKCCFLFPFFRNHSADGTARQEPWAFGDETLDIVRTYIKARYRLLPYLYNLFIEQERAGHPVIRPMLYHYPGFSYEASQFMVGDRIMQAPKLEQGVSTRKVTFPQGKWLDCRSGEWVSGPAEIGQELEGTGTPIFFPEGAIVPLSRHAGVGDTLKDIDFLLAFDPDSESANGSCRYEYDAGEGYGYKSGEAGVCKVDFSYDRQQRRLDAAIQYEEKRFGLLSIRLLVPGTIDRVMVNGREHEPENVFLEDDGVLNLQGFAVYEVDYSRLIEEY